MKNLIPLLLILLIVSCNESNWNSDDKTDLFKISYSDYKRVDLLKEYEKISDTSFLKSGYDPTHRITELKKGDETLILFSKIELDNERKEIYSILDTLQIKNLTQVQMMTIGYCEVENSLMEEIIAIVSKTDINKDTIHKINKAWKANAQSNKIEPIKNSDVMFCFNTR